MNYPTGFFNLIILVLSFVTFSFSMQFKTKEGRIVAIQPQLAAQDVFTKLREMHDALDNKLTDTSWKILFDLFLMDKSKRLQGNFEFKNFDSELKQALPFITYYKILKTDEADSILLLGIVLPLAPEVIEQLVCAYVFFYQGAVKGIFPKLTETQKALVNKYCFLAYKSRSADIPVAPIGLQALVRFRNKLPVTLTNQKLFAVDLSNCFLTQLEHWHSILVNSGISPEKIQVWI